MAVDLCVRRGSGFSQLKFLEIQARRHRDSVSRARVGVDTSTPASLKWMARQKKKHFYCAKHRNIYTGICRWAVWNALHVGAWVLMTYDICDMICACK